MHFVRTATFALVLVTALFWIVTAATGADASAAAAMGVIPARLSGLFELSPAVPAWLTPLTSTLVHGGLLHLVFNMLMLTLCGMMVERVLGPASLLLIYLIGAYAAALAQWIADPAAMVPVIGASGAVSAVIGTFSLSFGRPKQIVRSAGANRVLNALWLLTAWVVLQLMVGWVAGINGLLLATAAHIGGFIAGLALQRPLLMWRYRSA